MRHLGDAKPLCGVWRGNLRDVVEGVDDDETERHEEHDARRHDVGGDEEADPRHDDEDGRRQVDVQEVGRHAPGQLDLHSVDRVVACLKRINTQLFCASHAMGAPVDTN